MSYSQALEQQIQALRHLRNQYAEARALGLPHHPLDSASARLLTHAEPFYWAKDICRLIANVAKTIPESWAFRAEQLPVMGGFFWFSESILTSMEEDEVHEERCLVSTPAIAWNYEDGACVISIFCSQDRSAGSAVIPREVTMIREGETREEWHSRVSEKFSRPDLAMAAEAVRVFAAAVTFLEQRILTISQKRAERHTRKRLEAQEGFTHEPLVRVVELRRTQVNSTSSGEHETVDWAHQWIVSGHWRQQWYPSLNANQPRWIMPYIKGPEDRPLKPPRAKVFAVVR